MRKIAVFFLVLSFAGAQAQSFALEIVLDKHFPDYVYLQYDDHTDSSLVVNKQLKFSGTLKRNVALASFYVKNVKYWRMSRTVYLDSRDMLIMADIVKKDVYEKDTITVFNIRSVSGSPTTDLSDALEQFRQQHKNDPDYKLQWLEKVDAVAETQPQNPIAADLLYGLVQYKDPYDKAAIEAIYRKLDTDFQDEFPMRKIQYHLFPERFVQTNGPLHDFALPDPNGKVLDTRSLKGRWILLDFWASWCAPCREQFPELRRIYQKHGGSGFEIVGVSIDKDSQRWQNTLAQEKLPWINVREGLHLSGPVARKYNILGVPHNYLVAPDGKIIARDIAPEMLEKVLDGAR